MNIKKRVINIPNDIAEMLKINNGDTINFINEGGTNIKEIDLTSKKSDNINITRICFQVLQAA